MTYQKFSGPAPRILVFESRYWLDVACARAARVLGWEVRTVPVVMEGSLPRKNVSALLECLVDFRPDCIMTVNLGGMDVDGVFAHIFNELHVPLVAWFVDNPRTILMERKHFGGEYCVALTWDVAYIGYLRDMGFSEVMYAPLAADIGLFNDVPREAAQPLPPIFVGDSNTFFSRRAWERISNQPVLADAVTKALESGRVTRHALARGLNGVLEPSLVDCLTPEERRQAEWYLICEGTRRLRVAWIQSLEREGVQVMGDASWAEVCRCALPAVNYETDLAKVYAESEVNLNITSLQMPTAVNQRVFDCPAAGGFLLTDAQASLHALFEPGREMVSYESTEECVDLLRHFRKHPRERMEIANRGRGRVLAQHTYMHRMSDIAASLSRRYASCV